MASSFYEQMTGMKINYDKSDLLTIGIDEERVNEFQEFSVVKQENSHLST